MRQTSPGPWLQSALPDDADKRDHKRVDTRRTAALLLDNQVGQDANPWHPREQAAGEIHLHAGECATMCRS